MKALSCPLWNIIYNKLELFGVGDNRPCFGEVFNLSGQYVQIGNTVEPVTLYPGNCGQLLKVDACLSSQIDPIEFY